VNPLAALESTAIATLNEIALWGEDNGRVVEAAFDGYSRVVVEWRPMPGRGLMECDPVEWFCAGAGGCAIVGWGVVTERGIVGPRLGERCELQAEDVLVVTPRLQLVTSVR